MRVDELSYFKPKVYATSKISSVRSWALALSLYIAILNQSFVKNHNKSVMRASLKLPLASKMLALPKIFINHLGLLYNIGAKALLRTLGTI
jgi:hypothetical protein